MIEQLLPQLRRQIGLGVEEQRGDVVLQRAAASALVVEKVADWSVAHHDVARLKIAIEKISAIGASAESASAG